MLCKSTSALNSAIGNANCIRNWIQLMSRIDDRSPSREDRLTLKRCTIPVDSSKFPINIRVSIECLCRTSLRIDISKPSFGKPGRSILASVPRNQVIWLIVQSVKRDKPINKSRGPKCSNQSIKPLISQLIANQGAVVFFMCMGLREPTGGLFTYIRVIKQGFFNNTLLFSLL